MNESEDLNLYWAEPELYELVAMKAEGLAGYASDVACRHYCWILILLAW